MIRLLAPLALVLPVVATSVAPHLDDPAFGVACGRQPGEASPNDVIFHAGLNSPARIHVHVQAASLDPTMPADAITELAVSAGGFAASCTTDLGGHHHVYLNAPETGEVSITFRGYQAVTLRGLRGEREQTTVKIDPTGPVDVSLTW